MCVFYNLESIQRAITDTFQFGGPDNAKGHIPGFNTSAPFLMISWSHQGITIILIAGSRIKYCRTCWMSCTSGTIKFFSFAPNSNKMSTASVLYNKVKTALGY